MRLVSRLSVATVALVAVIAGGGAARAAAPAAPRPGVMLTATSIQITPPQARFAKAVLTVVGPNRFHYQKVVNGGEPIAFDAMSITDKDGNAVNLADGSYKWELRVLVPATQAQAVSQAPSQGADPQNEGPELKAVVYTGRFLIEGGSLRAVPNKDLGQQPRPVARAQSASPGGEGPAPSPPDDGSITIQTINPSGNYFNGDGGFSGDLCLGCSDGFNPPQELYIDDVYQVFVRFDDTGLDVSQWDVGVPGGTADRFVINSNTGGTTTPFTIEEATPSNTLYLDSTGKVGMGTSTPDSTLHVLADFVKFKLEDAGGGYFSLTTDSGSTFFRTKTSTGSETWPIELFHGAPTNSLVIRESGNIGIGTFSPGEKLDIWADAGADVRLRLHGAGGKHEEATFYDGGTLAGRFIAATGNAAGARYFGFIGYKDRDGNPLPIRFFTEDSGGGLQTGLFVSANQAAGTPGYVGIGTVTPTHPLELKNGAYCSAGGVWTNASSRAFKKDIKELPADKAMDVFKKLKPVTFEYKADPSDKHVGFIAEDVPDLVATSDRKGIATMDIVGVLTKVVQQQQKTIDRLAAEIEELKKQR